MQINKTESTDGFSLKSMYEWVKSLCDKDQESELIDKTKNLYNKELVKTITKASIDEVNKLEKIYFFLLCGDKEIFLKTFPWILSSKYSRYRKDIILKELIMNIKPG